MIFRAFLLALAVVAPNSLDAQPACPHVRLPAYAHNDYANARPLTDALALGYRGVEADIFLVDGVLRLGHDRRSARAGASLEAIYLAPLHAVIARCGPLASDSAPFLLNVELKEASSATFDSLVAVLARYPSVTATAEILLVGWTPAPPVLATAPFAIGLQYSLRTPSGAPGPALDSGVRLLSLDYGKTIGRWWVRPAARRRWLEALRAAKAAHPARRLRVHNVPADEAVYREILAAGVDLIGTEDLLTTARLLESSPIR